VRFDELITVTFFGTNFCAVIEIIKLWALCNKNTAYQTDNDSIACWSVSAL